MKKVPVYEVATAWNRGIPCNFSKYWSNCICFIYSFLYFWFNISKRLSEVRSFEIKWICWPMRQIQPETGEYLVFFFKTLIQLYLLRSFLYSLTYCIKEVIKGKIFWRLNEKSAGLWGSYSLKQGNPLQFFQTLIQLYLFLISLFLTYCIKEGIKGNILGH